ncbi:unnamed protein product [Enterobius vermicularis]|uniref:M20_dimer domain-containing protein n=1 Tax=Enterobius vermicularis TaxID=51028 RepID=A0A0N4UUX8_ENTVE|nr:unnamed protein product [Enterobius vermicularis]
MEHYPKFAKAVDARKKEFIERLREAVAIPSVSTEPARRKDVVRMVEWMRKQLEKLGTKCELYVAGKQTLHDGTTLDLPPILFGVLGEDKKKKTLLVYGHLDVQPAAKEDGWNTEPFELVEKDGKLFGRGSTDDKGPVVGWVNAIETLQKNNIEVPVNIKFCFEAMEESGSEGLEETLRARKDTFMKGVDFTCISDNYWLGKTKPCITYGLRGVCYYCMEISAAKQDLHSGCFGGTVYEPMADVVWMMNQLTNLDGHINIKGLNEMVAPVTEEERKLYEATDFDMEEYRKDIGAVKLSKKTKEDLLMGRWRNPTLSLHGIEGAFSGAGAKTVIPAKVIGKFSIRIVPNMHPDKVDKLVIEHLNELWKSRGSPNRFKAYSSHSGNYWLSDFKHPHYQCGARAMKTVYGVEPDYTREGGSIPITLTFEEVTGNNVLLLPVGAGDDMAHSQNEKINVSNYIEGTKVLGAYLLELGKM